MQQRSKLFSRQNKPPQDEPWLWLTREMISSAAWRALSNSARLVIDRVAIEHMDHGGQENGALVVTYANFLAHGVPRKAIAGAIREAVELGFLLVTDRGAGGNREHRRASTYALAWLPTTDDLVGRRRWLRFLTIEDAQRAAAVARQALAPPKGFFAPSKGAETTPLEGARRLAS